MGLSYRKTKRLGLLNLNLSKSGLGVSIGPRGAKISIGPRGANLNLGYRGFRFQQRLDSSSSSQAKAIVNAADIKNPIRSVDNESSHVYGFCSKIEDKLREPSYFVFAVGASIILCLFSLNVFTVLLGIILCGFVYFTDGIRKKVHLETIPKLDQERDEVFQRVDSVISNALINANSSKSIWGVSDVIFTADWKRNAGATNLVKRAAFKFKNFNHRFLKITPQPMCASWGKSSIIFIPSGILLIVAQKVKYVDYKNLIISPRITQFRESGSIPGDSVMVGQTWQYVRRDGGPDRRFSQNRKIPILEYGELRIFGESVFEAKMMFSRSDVPFMLEDVFKTIGSIIGTKRQVQ